MPEDRSISKEEYRKLFREKREQIDKIIEIFSETTDEAPITELATKLNDLINAEPTQKEKDFLLAVIIRLIVEPMRGNGGCSGGCGGGCGGCDSHINPT